MEEKKTARPLYNFRAYRNALRTKINAIPADDRIYHRWGDRLNRSYRFQDFTLDEIREIMRSGDEQDIVQLSLYYYRTDGEYRNNINFLASLFLYDTMVIPRTSEGKGSKAQIMNNFEKACDFVEALDLPNTLYHTTLEWLLKGVYYGILREKNGKVTLQDLPAQYCRSRFKDYNNLHLLEFNLTYFEQYLHQPDILIEKIIDYPEEIILAWDEWIKHTRTDPWVILSPSSGGVCFKFDSDSTPLLLPGLIGLKKLADAVAREEKRVENELYKLLIQKMPVDNGELVFQLDEVAEIHASVAEMLQDLDTVDVLTTFGDTDLESLQESTAAAQSADRIAKYKANAFDALGRSSILFNAENSSTLAYSIKKDEALMTAFLNEYETWIKYLLNERFMRPGLSYDFEILPTTVFNRQDLIGNYFRSAQYGYSKMYAGVAMGIKQRDQISLMEFENDYLKMSEKMIPLQSSYTTSGTAVANEEKSSAQKTVNGGTVKNLENKGGRPELPDEEKSEKTQANIAAKG